MAELHVVGISDCKASADPMGTVVTYALGSCVGVTLYDSKVRCGGLLHIMLPDSRHRSPSREFNPFMFADTGLHALLQMVQDCGAEKKRLVCKLAGGANMLKHSAILDIGKRNSEMMITLLRMEGIPIVATSLGGTVGRSMQLRLEDGSVPIRLLGQGEEVL